MAAPAAAGNVLLGRDARKPAPRTLLRFYGTRDVLLGLGALSAASRGGDARGWVAAGIGADVLDAGVMITEWSDMPEDKRVPGLLSALGAAALGAALLARRV
jgi:hypothetical protein